MRIVIHVAAALCLGATLVLTGCSESDEETEETQVEETEAEETEPVVAEPTPEEVPVAADFSDEAGTQVTEENYQAELDRLAAEIESN